MNFNNLSCEKVMHRLIDNIKKNKICACNLKLLLENDKQVYVTEEVL